MRTQDEQEFTDDDSDSPDEFDFDDGDATISCPHCGHAMYEDSPRCPNCENYLSAEEAPSNRRPWWFYIGLVLALWVFVRWLFV